MAACVVRLNCHCDGCIGACGVCIILCIIAGMSRSWRFCISLSTFSARQFCSTLCICVSVSLPADVVFFVLGMSKVVVVCVGNIVCVVSSRFVFVIVGGSVG